MNITPYERKINYYETDQMQVVHHSNYIRFFEEARIDYMSQLGLSYSQMEEEKIIIPVLDVQCSYQKACRFGETVLVHVKLASFTGVKMHVVYEIYEKESGELRTTGSSSHCFVDENFLPIRMKKRFPEIYETLMNNVVKE